MLTTHDLDVITALSDRYILAGDFNAKHRDWNCRVQNPSGIKLHTYCRRNSIEVSAPEKPTFYHRNSALRSSDVFDIVLSKKVNISHHITVLDEVLDSDHLPIEFQIHTTHIFTPPYKSYATETDWDKFSKITDEAIDPHLFVETTDQLETAIKNFQATIKTAIRYSSIGTCKEKQIQNSKTDEILKDYILHKRKFLKLFRQFGSPCYKTLYNKYSILVQIRLQELRNDSWNATMSRCTVDKVSPWQLINRIKLSRAPPKPTDLRDNQQYIYLPST